MSWARSAVSSSLPMMCLGPEQAVELTHLGPEEWRDDYFIMHVAVTSNTPRQSQLHAAHAYPE